MAKSVRALIKEITYKPKERVALFLELPLEIRLEVLMGLSRYIQSQLLSSLKKEDIQLLLEKLDPDDTTDLLQTLPKRKQNELLTFLSEELQNKISLLLKFDPKTAAGLMSLNYIQVQTDTKLKEVIEAIRVHEKRTGKLPEILVMEDTKLLGYVPMREFLYAQPEDKAGDFIRKIERIKHTTQFDAVVNHFVEHPHQKVAVLDENENILGILYSDDLLHLIHEQETSSLYNFAGVSGEETIFGSVKQKVRYRYRWLVINLATTFLASFTVSLFNDTISKYVLLAVYMPIVAGMGGNAATQTLAVLVRGIALRQIDLATALPTLRKELGAAFIHGILNGLLVAGVVIVVNKDVKIAAILATAMIFNMLVASFFGTLVPLIMTKLKKDPATSATVFITTATDVLGFLAFLGLATVILD